MSVCDFLFLLTNDDSLVAIYDMANDVEVFIGEACDAITECAFCDCEVLSFDLCPQGCDPRGVLMVINIECEDEEEEEE